MPVNWTHRTLWIYLSPTFRRAGVMVVIRLRVLVVFRRVGWWELGGLENVLTGLALSCWIAVIVCGESMSGSQLWKSLWYNSTKQYNQAPFTPNISTCFQWSHNPHQKPGVRAPKMLCGHEHDLLLSGPAIWSPGLMTNIHWITPPNCIWNLLFPELAYFHVDNWNFFSIFLFSSLLIHPLLVKCF